MAGGLEVIDGGACGGAGGSSWCKTTGRRGDSKVDGMFCWEVDAVSTVGVLEPVMI